MSDFAYPLHEECGVFGIYDRAGTEDVAAAAYSALYALQHRGQESCGIAVNDDGVIVGHRDLGLVNEVFTPAVLASLANPNAHMATGHVRYATAGSRVRANAHLAGAFAANTTLPVIGIPMKGGAMDGMDALLATVQMPSGIPVATVALNGAKNAAWLAAEILALSDDALAEKLAAERTAMAAQIAAKEEKLQAEIAQL